VVANRAQEAKYHVVAQTGSSGYFHNEASMKLMLDMYERRGIEYTIFKRMEVISNDDDPGERPDTVPLPGGGS
jgi:hypothetical protein